MPTVLVVTDNPSVRTFLEHWLKIQGATALLVSPDNLEDLLWNSLPNECVAAVSSVEHPSRLNNGEYVVELLKKRSQIKKIVLATAHDLSYEGVQRVLRRWPDVGYVKNGEPAGLARALGLWSTKEPVA